MSWLEWFCFRQSQRERCAVEFQWGFFSRMCWDPHRSSRRTAWEARSCSQWQCSVFRIHSTSTNVSSEETGATDPQVPQSTPPDGGWLPSGSTEESVYKLKHLRSIVVAQLPTDATSCREWRAAISRVDMSKTDVLVKWCTHALEGRGKTFRETLQASDDFIMLNKHIAAELIKTEVLSTNTELARGITSWVEKCAARREGPKGTPLLNLIISYYETGVDRSVALGQMHVLKKIFPLIRGLVWTRGLECLWYIMCVWRVLWPKSFWARVRLTQHNSHAFLLQHEWLEPLRPKIPDAGTIRCGPGLPWSLFQ